jgi:hypothetical protein
MTRAFCLMGRCAIVSLAEGLEWSASPQPDFLVKGSILPNRFTRPTQPMRIRLWFLASLLVSGISGLYMLRVLGPWEYYINVESGKLKAQLGDLYSRWVGTRALLLDGRNPYGPEVSHEIQMGFYGRIIEQPYGGSPLQTIDEQRFVYPVYVVFLLAPTVHVDFAQLQLWAPVVLAILTAVSVVLWLEVLRWRPPKTMVAALVLFVISSPQITHGLRLRQLGLLVGCLIAVAAWCVKKNHLATAGVVLAVATVKPQMVVLPLVWFLLWAAGDWSKRRRLIAGFGFSLAALVGAGEWILPGWIGYFIEGVAAYRKYFPTTSLLRLALGDWVGGALGAVLIAGALMLGWKSRKQAGDSPHFALNLAAFCMATALALPLLTPFNQVLLILPVMMLLRDWATLWNISRIAFVVLVTWPWATALLLLFFPPHLNSPNRLPLLPSALVLYLPFILPIVLFRTIEDGVLSSFQSPQFLKPVR